jgi:hypothetical protein
MPAMLTEVRCKEQRITKTHSAMERLRGGRKLMELHRNCQNPARAMDSACDGVSRSSENVVSTIFGVL